MSLLLSYLAGVTTLPAVALAAVGILRIRDWYGAPLRRWSAEARCAGQALYTAEVQAESAGTLDGEAKAARLSSAVGWHTLALSDAQAARRWARWCPWWPSGWLTRFNY